MAKPRRQGAAGFTLLEVVVAFAVLALALGASLETFSTGLRGVAVAGDQVGAMVRARSRLGGLGVTEPLTEGVTAGSSDDGYRWQLRVRPVIRHEGAVGETEGWVLYETSITYFWGDRGEQRSTKLTTLRLGPTGGNR